MEDVDMTPLEEEFVKWLSKGFKYDTAYVQEGSAKIYYSYIKQGIETSFYKIPGFTKSSLSRIRAQLINDGIFYTLSIRKKDNLNDYDKYLIPLHPHPLIVWIAEYETYTKMETLKEKFGSIINDLLISWVDNFGSILKQDQCFFPVVGDVGWKSNIAYSNLFGWIYAHKEDVKKVILLTPHLKLLKDIVFKKIIDEMVNEGINFEFIAFEDIKGTIKTSDNIRIWGMNRSIEDGKIDEKINVNVYAKRDMVLINHQDVPFFGYGFEKIEELHSYVGAVHCRCKEGHVYNIYDALKNLKKASNQPN